MASCWAGWRSSFPHWWEPQGSLPRITLHLGSFVSSQALGQPQLNPPVSNMQPIRGEAREEEEDTQWHHSLPAQRSRLMIHQDETAVAAQRAPLTPTAPGPETKSYNDITEQRRGSWSKRGNQDRKKEREKKSVLLPLNGNQMHGLTS